jgi:Tfp pilus assembly protein FimT
LLTSQSADLLRVAEELAAALVLARAAATTLRDALLPWELAVQLAWSGVWGVDGDVLAGSYSRAGSGSHAFGDLVR